MICLPAMSGLRIGSHNVLVGRLLTAGETKPDQELGCIIQER